MEEEICINKTKLPKLGVPHLLLKVLPHQIQMINHSAPYARWALLLGTSLKISGKYRLIRLHWGPLLWKLRAFVGTLIQNWTWCYFLLTFCIVNTSNLTNCANSQGQQDQDCLDWSLIFKISKYWIVKERTISKVDY